MRIKLDFITVIYVCFNRKGFFLTRIYTEAEKFHKCYCLLKMDVEIIVTNLLAFKFRISIEGHIDVPQRTIPNES